MKNITTVKTESMKLKSAEERLKVVTGVLSFIEENVPTRNGERPDFGKHDFILGIKR